MQRYDLLLTGKTLSGRSREDVAAALATVMRIPQAQALQLLSGQECVVKQNLDNAALQKYQAALNKAGGATRVREASPKPMPLLPQYVPNKVPLKKRITETLAMLLVLAYCGYSLWRGELFVPNLSRFHIGQGPGFALRGVEAWFLSAALFFGVLKFFVPVIDHYDKRNNEALYEKIAAGCGVLMWVFLALWLGANTFNASGGDLLALAVLVVVGLILLAMAWKGRKNIY